MINPDHFPKSDRFSWELPAIKFIHSNDAPTRQMGEKKLKAIPCRLIKLHIKIGQADNSFRVIVQVFFQFSSRIAFAYFVLFHLGHGILGLVVIQNLRKHFNIILSNIILAFIHQLVLPILCRGGG